MERVLGLVVLCACAFNYCCGGAPDCKLPETINVHLVSHTHDDVGWLKTVDEYYYGANNTIQHAGVQYILDSVIDALGKSQSGLTRRFIYVEQAFFYRWWREQSEETRSVVKKYLANGQLEFINGGWCMNDEASTHYAAIVDQMTLGLSFINTEFGEAARPRIGWHIDPFGHSSTMSSLLAMMGYDAFFFGRIDYQDKAKRLNESQMEMIWRGTADLGSLSDIFTGVTYHGYNPPNGFCFDQSCRDDPIQDDKNLENNNVDERVKGFVAAIRDQACHYRSGEIMMTMGSDFQYENAHLWFKNMDKLITYVRQYVATHGHNITLGYSTPTRYVDAVYAASEKSGLAYTVKTDDFFPYADNPFAYWSGYFTSRPALKRFVRVNNNILQACHQLQVFDGKVDPTVNCRPLWEAMGVSQHHDAVSGTSKQHVADDYAKRLALGADVAFKTMGRILSGWTGAKEGMEFCPYLNISLCPATEKSDTFSVTVYNPKWVMRTTIVRLPMAKRTGVSVVDHKGEHVVSQLMPVSFSRMSARGNRGHAEVELVFAAPLPAMGYSTFTILPAEEGNKNAAVWTEPEDVPRGSGTFSITNSYGVHATFSASTGLLTSVGDKDEHESFPLEQQFLWYNASDGRNNRSSQTSGAYIFRPNNTNVFPVNDEGNGATVKVLKGPVVSEVYQVFTDWVLQTVRVTEEDDNFVEFEYTVGPIPFKDDLGKEVVSRYSSHIASDGVFFTDSNARQMLRRERDKRPTWTLNLTQPVAANYYPVNSAIGLRESSSKTLTVLNDRAQGGSSMTDGSVELMVHRRLQYDDYRGVGEPLNETGVFGGGLVITGVHRVQTSAFKDKRPNAESAQRLFAEPLVFISRHLTNGSSRTFLDVPVPLINVLTVQHEYNVSDNTFLLRLEHFLPAAEGGAPVQLDVAHLFPGHTVSLVELTLSANLLKSSEKRLKWKEEGLDPASHPKIMDETSAITMNPMDIRTFRVTKA